MQAEPIASTSSAPASSAAPAANGSSASSLVHEGVASGLDISLHPLPILSISEHYTRTRLQSGSPDVQVYGALLGTQTGREIEIVNSFEVAVSPSSSSESGGEVDHGFFKTRQDQFKQVFPTLDFMGWYAIGQAPTPAMLSIHQQLLAYSESPLLLLLSPSPPSSNLPSSSSSKAPPQVQSQDLPLAVFEPTTEIVRNEPVQLFVRCAYTVETGEAERVAVDGIAKPSGSVGGRSREPDSALVANLTTQRNAIDMLLQRVRLLVHYLDRIAKAEAPVDHEVLRQIASLAASLPAATEIGTSSAGASGGEGFRVEYMKEFNDVLLTSLLASQTKSLSETNDLFDKYLFLNPDLRSGGDKPSRHHHHERLASSGPAISAGPSGLSSSSAPAAGSSKGDKSGGGRNREFLRPVGKASLRSSGQDG